MDDLTKLKLIGYVFSFGFIITAICLWNIENRIKKLENKVL
jgi:hypothetical protein